MKPSPSRRDVLAALGAGSAALAAGRGALAQAPGPDPARPPAFRGEHVPKPLPFDPAKLNGLSEKLVRSHWENNYGGSVRALNVVEQRLDALLAEEDLPAYVYGDLKREELVSTGSVVLHEHYFANLGGDGKPSGTGGVGAGRADAVTPGATVKGALPPRRGTGSTPRSSSPRPSASRASS